MRLLTEVRMIGQSFLMLLMEKMKKTKANYPKCKEKIALFLHFIQFTNQPNKPCI